MKTEIEIQVTGFNEPSNVMKEGVLPQLKLALKNEKLNVKSSKCKGDKYCESLKKDIEDNLVKRVFLLDQGYFWDQPSAYRFLRGLIRSANEFSSQDLYVTSMFMKFDHQH